MSPLFPPPHPDTRAPVIRALLDSPTVRGFFKRHREVESAPRWTCPECQFEQNQHHASHTPGCSST